MIEPVTIGVAVWWAVSGALRKWEAKKAKEAEEAAEAKAKAEEEKTRRESA